MERHSRILKKDKSALIVIDIQERILPVIFESGRVVQNSIKLIKGFRTLNLQVYYTEQYPKGLGPTSSFVKEALESANAVEKLSFSCAGAPGLFDELKAKGVEQVVLCGIESHVCVLQTALDLIAAGFQVQVASDAVSSRREFDYNIALKRMNSNGAEITLTESVLFELLEVCGTDQFKTISKLVK
ncbi:MAG TPA: hydrolase [Melioribacteraceae bacterium]|nr:hydrolase [Melioribacteraceae bacterium]